MDDFDLGLGLGGRRKSISAKMPGAMNLVLIVIVMIAALVSLGELSITPTGVVNVSLIVAVLYIISSIMYKNSYAEYIEREKDTEEYKRVRGEYDNVIKEIYDGGMLERVPDYCVRYAKEDLKHCRTSVLLDACIPYERYEEKYVGLSEEDLRSEDLGEDAIKCILAANKIKGISLSANALMSTGEELTLTERLLRRLGWRRGIGMESSTRQRIDMTTNMISRAITTLLAGTVAISVVLDDFSIETISLWAMRMLPVAIATLGGKSGGARNVRETLIPQLERKTKIIRIMLAWDKEREKEEKNEKSCAEVVKISKTVDIQQSV